MKQVLVSIVTLCIALSHGKSIIEEEIHEHVLKRFVRDTTDTASIFPLGEELMLLQCDLNDHEDKKDALQASISNAPECYKKKTIFEVSEEEYIEHVKQCTEGIRTNLKACLNDKQKYFPDFLLDRDIADISFKYKYKNIGSTYAGELHDCFKKINEPAAVESIKQCEELRDFHDSEKVPESLENFCKDIIPSINCYPDTMREFCGNTEGVLQFIKDFKNIMTKPCGLEEAKLL